MIVYSWPLTGDIKTEPPTREFVTLPANSPTGTCLDPKYAGKIILYAQATAPKPMVIGAVPAPLNRQQRRALKKKNGKLKHGTK